MCVEGGWTHAVIARIHCVEVSLNREVAVRVSGPVWRSGRQAGSATGWYAVLALAFVAALSAALVVGAGLSLWRGSAAQRAVSVPVIQPLPPGTGVVTVPAPHSAPPRQPHVVAPAAPPVTQPTVTHPAVTHHAVAAVTPSKPARHPATPSTTTKAKPPVTQPVTVFPAVPSLLRPNVLLGPVGIPARADIVRVAFRGRVLVVIPRSHPGRAGMHFLLRPVSTSQRASSAWHSNAKGHAYGRREHAAHHQHDQDHGDGNSNNEDGDG